MIFHWSFNQKKFPLFLLILNGRSTFFPLPLVPPFRPLLKPDSVPPSLNTAMAFWKFSSLNSPYTVENTTQYTQYHKDMTIFSTARLLFNQTISRHDTWMRLPHSNTTHSNTFFLGQAKLIVKMSYQHIGKTPKVTLQALALPREKQFTLTIANFLSTFSFITMFITNYWCTLYKLRANRSCGNYFSMGTSNTHN